MFQPVALILKPTPRRSPAQWADEHRILPVGSAEPGRWRSSRAPHMIPVAECVNDPNCETVVVVCGSQMSKTETACNVIGRTLDDDPSPLLYIAPTKSFCEKVFSPRLSAMIDNTPTLLAKKRPGKQESKTEKNVAGVKVRLAWAGSATEMAGDPARYVFVDERDRMSDDVDGEGDPKELADARRATYPDGQTWVFSTPTEGNAKSELDEKTGLEFWSDPEDPEAIQSATWKLFLDGTREHWAVPCPSCDDFFIPRFKLLSWPEGSTPEQARVDASLGCPHCGTLIDQSEKAGMHDRGIFVAPGQRITKTGKVIGSIPKTDVRSFWISGLMSPWRTWGDRAAAFLRALRKGDPETIQAVINTGFGELFSIAGDRTDPEVIENLVRPYKREEVPSDVATLTCGADVQKDRIYWSVRGWGADMFSSLIDYGILIGDTDQPDIWNSLAMLKDRHYGGLPITRAFVDSGYRTSYVYDFCRRASVKDWAFPTKGKDTIESSPLIRSLLDVGQSSGKRLRGGLALYSVNTDYFKKWLVDRFNRDDDLPGCWYLPQDVEDEYVKAMRSEARVVKPSGRATWIVLDKANHFWDCEVMALACAYSLNLQMVTGDEVQRERQRQAQKASAAVAEDNERTDSFRRNNVTSGSHFGGGGGWFGGRN